jgi:uncharacterized protein (TIGR02466 family)
MTPKCHAAGLASSPLSISLTVIMQGVGQIRGLFATPVYRFERLLPLPLVARLINDLVPGVSETNKHSESLIHTSILGPSDSPALPEANALLEPRLAEFGEVLLGGRLTWQVKECWLNVLEPGGYQALHNHANSLVSGVLYLTACDPSANTVFVRPMGGAYSFEHRQPETVPGPFNAAKWVSPAPNPGDLVLFPSHLLHEVPVNRGARRITLAFNAIPDRLDASGYRLSLAP